MAKAQSKEQKSTLAENSEKAEKIAKPEKALKPEKAAKPEKALKEDKQDSKDKKALVGQVRKVVKKSRRKLGEEKFEKELQRTISFLTELRDRLSEALGALALTFSDAEMARIEQAVPAGAVAGERYNTHQMAMLDSERG